MTNKMTNEEATRLVENLVESLVFLGGNMLCGIVDADLGDGMKVNINYLSASTERIEVKVILTKPPEEEDENNDQQRTLQ